MVVALVEAAFHFVAAAVVAVVVVAVAVVVAICDCTVYWKSSCGLFALLMMLVRCSLLNYP